MSVISTRSRIYNSDVLLSNVGKIYFEITQIFYSLIFKKNRQNFTKNIKNGHKNLEKNLHIIRNELQT